MTEKLYWQSPAETRFVGADARASTFGDRPSIVLARTLFYPEGGGQLGDTGVLVLEGVEHAVLDTQIDDAGVIHHVLAAPPGTGDAARVEGRIDPARRRDHSAQHTAQHALSRALLDVARAPTASSRLGAATCTIDVERLGIPDGELHRAEDLVNELVAANVPVRALHPTPEELARMPLRRAPKVTEGIRIIDIEGFDLTPCGGTHVARTGELGQVRIVALEKYKGMLRVTFHAALRALVDARLAHATLGGVARELSCAPADVPAALGKLRAELKGAQRDLEAARRELAALVAGKALGALPEGPGPHVVRLVRDGDLALLRALANELTADPRVVAIVGGATESGDLALIVQRGKDAVTFDCGAFLARAAKAHGGKGGGRPERAEGRLPRGTALDALV